MSDRVLEQRLATQRLTSAPADDPVEVVELLLCVQGQDAPLARYSLGLRTTAEHDDQIRAAVDDGRLIRTHILRPTWHLVSADDLRWILTLTSGKVESSLAGRHRRIGVDESTIDRAHGELASMLAGGQFMTAPEIGDAFASLDLPTKGEAVRHLLLMAELRGLICSGPLRGPTHTYALIDERLPSPSGPPLDRADAVRRFVRRYFRGHGPASEQDLRRWTTLTLNEIRSALADLDNMLDSMIVEDTQLWFDPDAVAEKAHASRRAFLLPTFDEAYLPYRSVGFDRIGGHPRGDGPHRFGEAGGGVIVVDRRDAGWWKRTVRATGPMVVQLALASDLDDDQRSAVEAEAAGLAAFFGREATLDVVEPD